MKEKMLTILEVIGGCVFGLCLLMYFFTRSLAEMVRNPISLKDALIDLSGWMVFIFIGIPWGMCLSLREQ